MAKIKINIKLKKKTLFILIPIVVVLLAGIIGSVFFFTRKKADDKPEAPPAYYLSKKEELSSITALVGDRSFEDLNAIEKAEFKEKEKLEKEEQKKQAKEEKKKAKEEKKKAKAEKKAQKEANAESEGAEDQAADTKEEGSEAAGETEEAAEEEIIFPDDKYRYFAVEDADKDVNDYIEYLQTEKNFIDTSEQMKEAEESGKKTDTDEKEGSELYYFDGPSENAEAYLSVSIEKDSDSYIITVSKKSEPWNTHFQALWNEQKEAVKKAAKKANDPKTSREEAEETVSALSQEELGLPESSDQYEFITAMGLMSLEGKDYYPVRAYKRQPDDTLWFYGTYLMDYDSKTVPYKYDEATGEVDPIR